MKYWIAIKNNRNQPISAAIQLLLLVSAIYIFFMGENLRLYKVFILFLGLIAWFFSQNKIKSKSIWIVILALLVLDLFNSYFWVANHHFVLLFMVLSVIFYNYSNNKKNLLDHIKWIVVIVVIFSAIQKLMSSEFMSGEFYYQVINRGFVFRRILNLFPESVAVIESNAELISNLHATDPNLGEGIVLKQVIPQAALISTLFAWITVFVEFFVAIALFLRPKNTWTHVFFILMILGILSIRLETGFMALLAICGVFLCKNEKLRLVHIALVLGCITLIVTKIGYH